MLIQLWLPLTGHLLSRRAVSRPDGSTKTEGVGDWSNPVRFPDANDFSKLGMPPDPQGASFTFLDANYDTKQALVEVSASPTTILCLLDNLRVHLGRPDNPAWRAKSAQERVIDLGLDSLLPPAARRAITQGLSLTEMVEG